MKKKDLLEIASMFVMTLLLPLLSALIFIGCEIIAHPTSIKMIWVCKIIIFGIPILLLLAYEYITKEKNYINTVRRFPNFSFLFLC